MGKTKILNEINGSSIKTKSKPKVIIIGLPNTGKSSIFNNLTGEYSLVANYSMTTIENERKSCKIENVEYEIIDTPGLHCLFIHSVEELIIRDLIFSEKPDVIVQCSNARQLKQSLILTIDIQELNIPLVLCLNIMDEILKSGVWIDSQKLSQILGIQVVENVALHGIGTEALKKAIFTAYVPRKRISYNEITEKLIQKIEKKLPPDNNFARKISILMLQSDPFIRVYIENIVGKELSESIENDTQSMLQRCKCNINLIINKKRSEWIENIHSEVVSKSKISKIEISNKIGKVCRHPVFGLPILAFSLYLTFLFVVNSASFISGNFELFIFGPIIKSISSKVTNQLLNEFLIGNYGLLTLGIVNALVTVLPILTIFFLIFAFFEDVGYIPNLCILVKRISEKMGLTGKSIMTIVLGFGCKTMATMVTRGLTSKKEKYIAIYLIAFGIPCSSQMGVNIGILGKLGMSAVVIAFSFIIVVEILSGIILNKVLKEEEDDYFIQELPPIRLPNITAILKKTYYRVVLFLKEAFPVFIIAAVTLFVIDKLGVLNFLKTIFSPIVTMWLGLPLNIVDALLLCLARHEAAAALIMNMCDSGQLNFVQCIVSVVLTTMLVPCFANIVAMCKELGIKTGLLMALIINISALFLSGILNYILTLLIRGN